MTGVGEGDGRAAAPLMLVRLLSALYWYAITVVPDG